MAESVLANLENEALRRELEEMRAQNAALKAKAASRLTLSFKVSDKGAVSVYGLGRFPVTLYQEQWDRLLAKTDELRTFMANNVDKLSKKAA